MAHANIFGTQPVASAQRRGGGGGGGGGGPRIRVPHHHPGSGGGGGGGGGRLPNNALYGGRQGEALANQSPEKFIRDLLGRSGLLDFSGTEYGDYANNALVQRLLNDYSIAQDDRQRTSPIDYFKKTYGAGWLGKKGKNFQAGTLPGVEGPGSDQYADFQSNVTPEDFLRTQQVMGGGAGSVPGGGNADFDRYVSEIFNPSIIAQRDAERARTGNATLSLNDMVAGRDLVGEARRGYLFRPNSMRSPGPISLAGSYSWWD